MSQILIVEDDAEQRVLLAESLSCVGYEVVLVNTTREALARLRNPIAPPIELVITDVFMPGMDGITLLGVLRNEFKTLKVVAIAGGGVQTEEHPSYLIAAEFLGAVKVLQKPFNLDQLLGTVEGALSKTT